MSIDSDDRVRGYSVSGGKPAASLSLSFDDPGGIYANASGTVGPTRDHGLALLGAIGNIGYARRIAGQFSLDGGISYTRFPHLGGGNRNVGYTEIYLGTSSHSFATHLYYSPDYFRRGTHTLYGEVDGTITPIKRFRLNGHIGLTGYVARPVATTAPATRYDWGVTLARRLGPMDVHAGVSGGGPGRDYYGGQMRNRTAFVAGASWTF